MLRHIRWLARALLLASVLTSCANATPNPHIGVTGLGRQPNIVFVLTDDLSTDLVQYMPHVLALERTGTTFTNYTVSDSFCCPSRASIFTGEYPHDTGVFTNTGLDGGFGLFHRRGEEEHTFATALEGVGYRTAFMGKYLNGYVPSGQFNADGEREPGNHNWVPPGWSTWDAAGSAYHEYDYTLNESHHVQHFGHAPQDYLTDVLAERGTRFIARSATEHRPFLLELATFAPHLPATPAPRDVHSFRHLHAPRDPAWNRAPSNPPSWLAGAHLTRADLPALNRVYRKRVRAVQAVDRMIGQLEQTLRASGQADHTVFVFSSDNGFHIGQYGLYPGKLTAFDTDIQVPLIVTGPHIPAGRVDPSVVQNVDLAPTFEQIGGAQVPLTVDGHSFVPLLLGQHVPWRIAALVEHHGADFHGDDPDQQIARAGNPTTYEAIRTPEYTYVQYANGEHEYYDRLTDPWELHNSYGSLSPARIRTLDAQVLAMSTCHGGADCWAAAEPAD